MRLAKWKKSLFPTQREGWVESLRALLDSYSMGTAKVDFDYTEIRPAGVPIKGFGGESSGAEPLIQLHDAIRNILDAEIGQPISITSIVDIMNLIGKCVVAGNVRRTAEIVFGEPDSDEYLDLKNYEVNPHRAEYGWTSNNSIFAELGMNYEPSAERVRYNGEPGYAWLENMKNFGRMADAPDFQTTEQKVEIHVWNKLWSLMNYVVLLKHSQTTMNRLKTTKIR